jgi:uncharacterized integral membrane protein
MGDELTASRVASIRRRQTLRLTMIALVLCAAAALAIDNRGSVTLGYVVGEREAPLVIALVVAFVLGVVVTWLSTRRGRGRPE